MSMSTFFQSCRDNFLSSWVEPVLTKQRISVSLKTQHTDSGEPFDPQSNALPTEQMRATACIRLWVSRMKSVNDLCIQFGFGTKTVKEQGNAI